MSIRAMEQPDLIAAHKLSMGERWPHRRNDWQMMLEVGEGLVAELNGDIIATAMWFPAGKDRGILGMVIVSRQHRGAGIGRLVMEAAIERCGYATLLLNATASGLPLYRRLGFRGIGEIVQHQGAAFSAPIAIPEVGERIRPIGLNDRERVRAMVADATGLERTAILDMALENGQGVALARDEELIGVALSRRFGRGYSVGPVVAPDLGRAKTLISHWLGARAGSFTRIDVPSDCGLCDWLDELHVTRVASVVTMVRGPALPEPAADGRSFAILTQALG